MKVRLHWSAALLALALCLLGAARYSDSTREPIYSANSIIVGVVLAIGLIFSLFAHEMFHYIAAKNIGLEVDNLTIHFFGGYVKTDMTKVNDPKDYTIVSGAGLLANCIAIAVAWAIALATKSWAAFAMLLLVEYNILLLLLNAIPMFPLDGWRVAYGVAWTLKKNKNAGERIAHAISIPSSGVVFFAFIFVFFNSFIVFLAVVSFFTSVCFFLSKTDAYAVLSTRDADLARDLDQFVKKINAIKPTFVDRRRRALTSLAITVYFLRSRRAWDELNKMEETVKKRASFVLDEVYDKANELKAWCESALGRMILDRVSLS